MVLNLRRTEADFEGDLDVYIGRAGKGLPGYFGNPIVPGRQCLVCRRVHPTKQATLACFEQYATKRVETDPIYASRVAALSGKRLFCFCAPSPCHGDILEKLAGRV